MPGADVTDHLHNLIIAVQKDGINGEAHEERMDGVALENQHSHTRRKSTSSNEPSHPRKERASDLGLNTLDFDNFHAAAYSSTTTRNPTSKGRIHVGF